jgi:hypothetical protein
VCVARLLMQLSTGAFVFEDAIPAPNSDQHGPK